MKMILPALLALALSATASAVPVRISASEKSPGFHFELPGNWTLQESKGTSLLYKKGRPLPVGVIVRADPSVTGPEVYQKYCLREVYPKLTAGQKVEKIQIGGYPGVAFRDVNDLVTLHVGCKGTIVTIGYLPSSALAAVCNSFSWDKRK